MIAQKIVVDRLASTKTLFSAMPEMDSVFAQFPAQANLAALIKRQEIEQPDVQVFDQGAGFFDLLHGVLERGGAAVAARPKREKRGAVDAGAPGDTDPRLELIQFVRGLLIPGLVAQGVAEKTVEFGNQTLGVGKSEVSRHFLTIIFP